jgi:hypothetical protein
MLIVKKTESSNPKGELGWGRILKSSGISDTLMHVIHFWLNGCLGRGSLPSLFVFNQRNWVTE